MAIPFEIDSRFLMPGIQQIASRSRLVIERGEGAILWDEAGHRLVDMFAGVGVCSVGHSHPRFIQAVTDQLNKVIVGSFTTRVRAELVRLLASVTPEGLDRSQFYSGGSEAVEAALRLAKSYTKRYEFLGFWGGFHGKTLGTLGLCGVDYKHGYGPLPPGYHIVPYADCYRCPFNLAFPDCELACVKFARDTIERNLAGRLAAIVVEPVQGTNGNVVPPKPFLPALRKLADEHGALLIADEIITGFGRTGQMFVSSTPGIDPDIVVMGKGMANGLPISGIVSSDDVASATPFAEPSGSSSSFGGNPLSTAAALATLQIILDEHLDENAIKVGAWLLQSLQSFETRYPFVGKVQGQGLLLGIELVQDKDSKQPLNSQVTGQIFDRLLEAGVIMMAYSAKIRINPPLCISQELCEQVVAAMHKVFDSIASDYF